MNNIREYVLCRDDILYFIVNYLDLEFRGFQFDIIDKFLGLNDGETANILGHRACGLTTMSCVYALWKALFYPDSNTTFYIPKASMAQNTENIFYSLYESFIKNWDKTQKCYTIYNKTTRYIKFDNNSYVHFCYSIEQMRGNFLGTIICDHLYMYPSSIDIFNNFLPCGNKFIILNTALPLIKHELEDVGIEYKYPWYCNSTLTLNWYLTMLNSLGNTRFLLEYGCTRGT